MPNSAVCIAAPMRGSATTPARPGPARANHFLLELFHGPTLAFKDFAMQLIGQMFEAALVRRGRRVTIVGATSGDTGSAAIEAFRGLEPSMCSSCSPKAASEVQRRQMTTPVEANVHALALTAISTIARRGEGHVQRFRFRDEVGWRPSTRSTGRGFWRRWSITSRRRSAWARRTARSASPCPRAISGHLRGLYRQAGWGCRSAGW